MTVTRKFFKTTRCR